MQLSIVHRPPRRWGIFLGLTLLTIGLSMMLLLSVGLVHGAIVQVSNCGRAGSCVLNVANGNLTIVGSDTQRYNSFTLIPSNNTFAFNVTSQEVNEPGASLTYKVSTSGTITLVYYQTIKANRVVCQTCTVVQNTPSKLIITYPNGAVNSQLTIIWIRAASFGIVLGSSFFTMIMIATGILYASSGISVTLQMIGLTGTLIDGSRHRREVHWDVGWLMIGLAAIVGYLFMLVFASQIFGLACPAGYVCTG